MAETQMETDLGIFEIRRRHSSPRSPLRGWTAADVLVHAELAEVDASGTDPGRMLIVNDAWGALAVGVARWKPICWNDSARARASIAENLATNRVDPHSVELVSGDQLPFGHFDTVVIMVPKSLSLLEWQVQALATIATPSTRIIAAGMSRQIPKRAVELLAELGNAEPRRAVGKARIIDVGVAASPSENASPQVPLPVGYETDEGIVVHKAPGVFSANHLDVGTALLLDMLGDLPAVDEAAARRDGVLRAIDVGCGAGVIAATLARRHPETAWTLADVSDLALLAAQVTWASSGLSDERATFLVADGLGGLADAAFDLVVSNPPFHQDHAVDPELTERLLRDMARVLQPGGAAVLVAQRHLRLHEPLQRIFGAVEAVSRHPSHVVLVAHR